jgi:protein phosphatase 1 regulatory subunit 3A/B/C/D/E
MLGSMDATPTSRSSYRRPSSFYRSSSTSINQLAVGINNIDFGALQQQMTNGNNRQPAPPTASATVDMSLYGRRTSRSNQNPSGVYVSVGPPPAPAATSSSVTLAAAAAAAAAAATSSSSVPPLRSCLVVRGGPEAVDTTSLAVEVNGNGCTSSDCCNHWGTSTEGPTSPLSVTDSDGPLSPASRAAKKRVVFADAKGLSLTQIKMMTEPSDCPPRWTAEFLEQVTGGASPEVGADRWELTFAQPASDYLEFRSRLDLQNLSLENVVVQEANQQLVGTIKVKNLAFDKQVTVRATFDNWLSHRDFAATFAPSGLQGASGTQAISLFDTFSFQVPIPAANSTTNRIQFCIRFSSEAGEFWDNNQGKNYVLVKADPLRNKSDQANNNNNSQNSNNNNKAAGNNHSRSPLSPPGKYNDILSAKGVDHWTEFSSWNHLVNDSPYW